MTDARNIEEKIIAFSSGVRFADLPAAAVRAAKMRVIDSVGVAFAAYDAPTARIARRLAQPTSGDMSARIWGSQVRTTLESAAFANGVMVRYLDLNDAWRTKDAHHPSDYLPGILAVAEYRGASGKDFIAALAVAYEIVCRFTDAVPFNTAGWDQPVTGAVAMAMAAGRLLGLSREALMHALALAVVPNLCTYQTRAGELSMWKGCAGPNGARNGVFAALLAAEGMSGPYEAFDGVFGVWNQTLGGTPYDVPLGSCYEDGKWGIVQTNIKTHPVRDSCQLPIDTALELRPRAKAGDIAALRIETYRSAWEGAVKDRELWSPKTRETADHSMLFAVACTLIDGEVTPPSFEKSRFTDRDILDLIGRTTVDVIDEFTAATPLRRNCRITATLNSGGSAVAHRVVTLADIERGMSDQELARKFEACTAGVFVGESARVFLDAAASLERISDVGRIVDHIRL
jgi:2-methylcitrate dehydratase